MNSLHKQEPFTTMSHQGGPKQARMSNDKNSKHFKIIGNLEPSICFEFRVLHLQNGLRRWIGA